MQRAVDDFKQKKPEPYTARYIKELLFCTYVYTCFVLYMYFWHCLSLCSIPYMLLRLRASFSATQYCFSLLFFNSLHYIATLAQHFNQFSSRAVQICGFDGGGRSSHLDVWRHLHVPRRQGQGKTSFNYVLVLFCFFFFFTD